MKILVVLQNAWATSHEMAERFRQDYQYWLETMRVHRTGRRLLVVIPVERWDSMRLFSADLSRIVLCQKRGTIEKKYLA